VWSRLARTLRGWLVRRPPVDFVFHPRYAFELPLTTVDGRRADKILGYMATSRGLRDRQVHRARPASLALLGRVHSHDYLDALQHPGSLTTIVGVELPDAMQDGFLTSQRYLVGGTLLATQLALASRSVAVNLGGGLHHASGDRGQGFCAFNDVAIAIAYLREHGFREPVLVVDLDLHDGDGTRAVFARDAGVHTLSIHNRHLGDVEALASTSIQLGPDVGDQAYARELDSVLPRLLDQVRPGLVYFLAGSDVAAGDAIGNWRLSPEAILRRDRLVTRLTRDRSPRIPLVVLMAGGYGPQSWRHSARFFSWLLDGDSTPVTPRAAERTLRRFRGLAARLSDTELTAEPTNDWELSEEDLDPGSMEPASRLLGFYSKHGVELALERFGLLERLRDKGFRGVRLEFDLSGGREQTVRLRGPRPERHLLGELRVRRDVNSVPRCELLSVEWLLLQNPREPFTAARPRLPGQDHPGLGLFREVAALLVLACERLKLDGVALRTSHYHVAVLASGILRFLDPVDQAHFRELRRLFEGLSLQAAAHALDQNLVLDRSTGRPMEWRPGKLVLPVSEALKEQLHGADYENRVRQAAENVDFGLK